MKQCYHVSKRIDIDLWTSWLLFLPEHARIHSVSAPVLCTCILSENQGYSRSFRFQILACIYTSLWMALVFYLQIQTFTLSASSDPFVAMAAVGVMSMMVWTHLAPVFNEQQNPQPKSVKPDMVISADGDMRTISPFCIMKICLFSQISGDVDGSFWLRVGDLYVFM